MNDPDRRLDHLRRLSAWRGIHDRDVSLGFLRQQFQQQVARPYRQLQSVIDIWQRLVPAELRDHTRLESLNHGVLRVAVDSSAHLFELHSLLRSGLQAQLVREHRGPLLRRVQMRVDDGGPEQARRSREAGGPAGPGPDSDAE